MRKVDAKNVASSMNTVARNLVRAFVLANVELEEPDFEDAARRRLDAYLDEHEKTRGEDWDDLDDLWAKAIWRAMWREYRVIKASGGMTGSKAVN